MEAGVNISTSNVHVHVPANFSVFITWFCGRKQESLLCGYLPGVHNQFWKVHENIDFEDESRPIKGVVDTEARALGADAGEAYE